MAIPAAIGTWANSLRVPLSLGVRECWEEMMVTLPLPKQWVWSRAHEVALQEHVARLFDATDGRDTWEVEVHYQEEEREVLIRLDRRF